MFSAGQRRLRALKRSVRAFDENKKLYDFGAGAEGQSG